MEPDVPVLNKLPPKDGVVDPKAGVDVAPKG